MMPALGCSLALSILHDLTPLGISPFYPCRGVLTARRWTGVLIRLVPLSHETLKVCIVWLYHYWWKAASLPFAGLLRFILPDEVFQLSRVPTTGFEPATLAWQASMLPLHYVGAMTLRIFAVRRSPM